MTRDEAWRLLCEYTQSENLRRHALAVEACMRYYARIFGEDEELWGVVGLLHDFDYERYPSLEEHPFRGMEILRARGAPEVIIRAVGAHANHTGIPRESLLERAIFACDEISGFVIAVALVKGRTLSAVTPESVRKRMKEKGFARGVNRDDLLQGAEELGIPFDEHVEHVVRALQGIADQLGLNP
ncbi:HDIG domain-containing metalloprotein [Synechococcus sp. RC10A2]|jgi:putative nucleotidyltransferase with HDIG domain|uniref:HDIG domain-containing metalloprotein n=1 Tax=Synechococcus sp. RC10A2 TaxID=2964529 RepID=UPI0039C6822A